MQRDLAQRAVIAAERSAAVAQISDRGRADRKRRRIDGARRVRERERRHRRQIEFTAAAVAVAREFGSVRKRERVGAGAGRDDGEFDGTAVQNARVEDSGDEFARVEFPYAEALHVRLIRRERNDAAFLGAAREQILQRCDVSDVRKRVRGPRRVSEQLHARGRRRGA